MSQSSSATDRALDVAAAAIPRRFTLRDLELVAALAAVWLGAFALNWWHVIP